MHPEALPKAPRKSQKTFGPEDARRTILEKLTKSGAKGSAALVTSSAPEAKRLVIEQVLQELQEHEQVFVDRTKAKPKFFLWEHRPQGVRLEDVCSSLLLVAARQFPTLLSSAELKKTLSAKEKPLLDRALAFLREELQFIPVRHKTTELFLPIQEVYAAAPPASAPATVPSPTAPLESASVWKAYHDLIAQTKFPAVEISALQRALHVPLEGLRQWLLGEYHQGRAIFSFGDWSLADEASRAGAITVSGERYLLVRLQE